MKALYQTDESPSVCFNSLGDSDQVINGDLCLQLTVMHLKGGDERKVLITTS